MDLLDTLTQRSVVTALAIIGAILVMSAGLVRRGDDAAGLRRAEALSKAGYGVTFLSIVLFIVAGFMSGR